MERGGMMGDGEDDDDDDGDALVIVADGDAYQLMMEEQDWMRIPASSSSIFWALGCSVFWF